MKKGNTIELSQKHITSMTLVPWKSTEKGIGHEHDINRWIESGQYRNKMELGPGSADPDSLVKKIKFKIKA